MKFSTIGVLGGGQLGRMLASAAHDLGMRIAVLDPDRAAPAGQVANRHVIGDFREPEHIRELAEGCDILTVEIEHVNADTLDNLARQGVPVQPAPGTLRLIQDKLLQKRHLAEHGIPVAPFAEVSDEAALAAARMLAVSMAAEELTPLPSGTRDTTTSLAPDVSGIPHSRARTRKTPATYETQCGATDPVPSANIRRARS